MLPKSPDRLADRYANDEIDAVYLLYNEFKSMLSQQLMCSVCCPSNSPRRPATRRTDYILRTAC
jgi:F0F1-type ATP synthase gamma subunit